MSPLDRITIDQSVRFGKPCVRGTRITVGDVLANLAAGMTEDEVLAEFKQLTREDIRACLAYAAERLPGLVADDFVESLHVRRLAGVGVSDRAGWP
jgi:uncharacterized protein (DUF433 family)